MSSAPDSTPQHTAPRDSTPPSEVDRSTGDLGVADLLGRLSDQFTTLLRQEVELAKAEAKQEITTAAKAGAEFGAAAVAGHMALLFLSFAAAWGLSDLLEQPALGFVIVGIIYAIGAAVAAMQGKKDAQDVDTSMPQTTDSLQATTEWAKDKP